MAERSPITRRHAELIAERLRLLGQPLRVQLLDRLAVGATAVHELVEVLGSTQQNVSQHLRILLRAGVVARHQEGTRARYEIVDPNILALLEHADGSLSHYLGELTREIEPPAEPPPTRSRQSGRDR